KSLLRQVKVLKLRYLLLIILFVVVVKFKLKEVKASPNTFTSKLIHILFFLGTLDANTKVPFFYFKLKIQGVPKHLEFIP
ncbi:hypothetical protein SKM49_12780, partial [Acinetobacter faecalis]